MTPFPQLWERRWWFFFLITVCVCVYVRAQGMAPLSPQGRGANTSLPSEESGGSFLRSHLMWDMALYSQPKGGRCFRLPFPYSWGAELAPAPSALSHTQAAGGLAVRSIQARRPGKPAAAAPAQAASRGRSRLCGEGRGDVWPRPRPVSGAELRAAWPAWPSPPRLSAGLARCAPSPGALGRLSPAAAASHSPSAPPGPPPRAPPVP